LHNLGMCNPIKQTRKNEQIQIMKKGMLKIFD
jgi:hypothetical protein